MSNNHHHNQYYFNSNLLCQRYIDGSITLEDYASSISELIDQEVLSTNLVFGKEEMKDDLYKYEMDQQSLATLAKEEAYKKRLEEERYKSLAPDEKLYETREEYYKIQVPKLIDDYRKDASKYRFTHNIYQWIIILGSAFTTSTTGITIFSSSSSISIYFKILAASFSLLVTVAASATAYFKYRERSINAQKTADDIEYESDAIKLGAPPYSGGDRKVAMGMFTNTIVGRIKEQKEQQLTLEQPSEAKKLQAGG